MAERQDTVKFSPTDGTNTPTINLILKQAGTGSAPDFRFSTNVNVNEVLSAAEGSIVATIELLGNSTGLGCSDCVG